MSSDNGKRSWGWGSAPGVSGLQFDGPPDERIRLRLPVGHEGLPDVHRARRQGQ